MFALSDNQLLWVLVVVYLLVIWSLLFVNHRLQKLNKELQKDLRTARDYPWGRVMVTLRSGANAWTFLAPVVKLHVADQTMQFTVLWEFERPLRMDVDGVEWTWFPVNDSPEGLGAYWVQHSFSLNMQALDTMTMILEVHIAPDANLRSGPLKRPAAKRV